MFDYFGLGKSDVSDRSNKDQCHNASFVVCRAQAKERLLKYDSKIDQGCLKSGLGLEDQKLIIINVLLQWKKCLKK
ncbi:hypothetical protein BpHYR1_037386 [Brachionus plicatilis]|uniref:Uncharacterized protein n=1 Tax=Brachionus plicatilis TaxID=10195 RepID=A0A3M7QJJ5_BRAPC|nr:hypothetical protein BpHYR1_037386 [Brachionus plicatilis]